MVDLAADGRTDARGCPYYEPRREKTGFLHMRKQRPRSTSW